MEPFVSRSRAYISKRRKHGSQRRSRRIRRNVIEVVETKMSKIIVIILGARRSTGRINVTVGFELRIESRTKEIVERETVNTRDELWSGRRQSGGNRLRKGNRRVTGRQSQGEILAV